MIYLKFLGSNLTYIILLITYLVGTHGYLIAVNGYSGYVWLILVACFSNNTQYTKKNWFKTLRLYLVR